jgi:hypothetical protein
MTPVGGEGEEGVVGGTTTHSIPFLLKEKNRASSTPAGCSRPGQQRLRIGSACAESAWQPPLA